MAVSITSLDAKNSGTGTTIVSNSISPTANKVVLAAASVRNGSSINPTASSMAGCGLTWTQVGTGIVFDTASSSRRSLFLYWGIAASPSAGSVTFTAGQSNTDFCIAIAELTGADTTTPIITTNIATNKDETLSATSLTVTLPNAFSSVNNATFGAFGTANDTDGHVAGTGFTITTSSPGPGTNGLSCTTEFRADNDTTANMTFSSGVQFGGIACEIKAVVTTSVKDLIGGFIPFAR